MRIGHGCRLLCLLTLCTIIGCAGDPKPPIVNSQESQPRLVHAAQTLEHGRFEQAAGELEDVIRHHPKDPQAFTLLASAYQALGRSELAEAFYLEALRIDPDAQAAVQGLCRLALSAGRYDVLNYYFKRLKQPGGATLAAEQLAPTE